VDELLLDLMIDPADEAFLVYADAIARDADPRAELIVVQIELAKDPAPERKQELEKRQLEIFEEHRDQLIGPLDEVFDGALRDCVRWRGGFLESVRLERSYELPEALETLFAHPSAALLRELVLASGETWRDLYVAELAVLDRVQPNALRRLVLNDLWPDQEPDRPRYFDNTWFGISDLSRLSTALPDLEALALFAGDFELGDLRLPALRSLMIRTGSLRRARLPPLFAHARPALTQLELWFGQAQYGADCTATDLGPLFAGTQFPALRDLALANAEFTDELAEALATSALLPRLSTLSLAYGTLSDVGARTIARHAERFRHLTRLDLRQNFLDAPSRSILAATGLPVDLDGQRSGADRYAVVGE